MRKAITFFSFIIIFLSFFLRIYFVGFDFIVFVPFGAIILLLFFAFVFSSENEKIAQLVFFALFLLALIAFIYYSVFSYLEKTTCRGYEDYHCIVKMAIKKQNSSLCDMAKDDGVLDESSRAWCYRDLSKNWKDASICEKVKIGEAMSYFGDYYDCISNIAVNTNNPSLCEKIEYDKKFSPNKKECYSNF